MSSFQIRFEWFSLVLALAAIAAISAFPLSLKAAAIESISRYAGTLLAAVLWGT